MEPLGPGPGLLSWYPQLIPSEVCFRLLPPTPPFRGYELGWSMLNLLPASTSWLLLSVPSDRTQGLMLETRRLHSSAPCRLRGGTAARAAP